MNAHVDDSEAFIGMRSQLEFGGELRIGATGPKPVRADWACKFKHTYEVCRCTEAVILTGQDERERERER